jgi:hypothetical protein
MRSLVYGGYLGGHLTFVKAVNVNHTAWPAGPDAWTQVVRRGGSGRRHAPEGRRCGGADPAYRRGDAVQAIDATCTHMGGPLADGKFATTA